MSKSQVWFLPWADVSKEVQLGPVRLWPWDASKISDPKLATHLQELFHTYVDNHGKPVKTITIASYRDSQFKALSEKQMKSLREAIDLWLFCKVAPSIPSSMNSTFLGAHSGDRFQLIGQGFKVGNYTYALERGGALFADQDFRKLRFEQPRFWNMVHLSDDLQEWASAVYSRRVPQEVRDRLFQSIGWFRLATTDEPSVTLPMKCVLMTTAIEVLLQFPPRAKTHFFHATVESLLRGPRFRWSRRPDRLAAHSSAPDRASNIAWWAWEFYELRNKIVHGDRLSVTDLGYRRKFSQLRVAQLVYFELVLRIMFDFGLQTANMRWSEKWHDGFDPNWLTSLSTTNRFARMANFEDVHRELGWYPRLRPRNDLSPSLSSSP